MEEAKFAYKAVNRLTQGGNADLIKLKIVETDQLLHETGMGRLMLNVHDDLGWSSNNRDSERLMREAMCDMSRLGLKVPMEVDIGRGANWSEATW